MRLFAVLAGVCVLPLWVACSPPTGPALARAPEQVVVYPGSFDEFLGFSLPKVSWHPAGRAGSPVTGYRVFCDEAGWSVTVDAKATSTSLDGIPVGRGWVVGVAALTAAGEGPPGWSAPFDLSLYPPPAPGDVSLFVSPEVRRLSWEPPPAIDSAPVHYYEVVVGAAVLRVDGTTYDLPRALLFGSHPGVRAVNSEGQSRLVYAQLNEYIQAPTLSATPLDGAARLQLPGWEVRVTASDGQTLLTSSPEFTVTGLENGRGYRFIARSVREWGESLDSAPTPWIVPRPSATPAVSQVSLSAGSGCRTVGFTLQDPLSRPVNVNLGCRSDQFGNCLGPGFFPARSLELGGTRGLRSSPEGVRHELVWDTTATLWNWVQFEVGLVLQASVDGSESQPALSPLVLIDNLRTSHATVALAGQVDAAELVFLPASEDRAAAVVIATSAGALELWAGDGAGGLAPQGAIATVSGLQRLTAGDLNGDGAADLIAARTAAPQLQVFLSNGAGSFAGPEGYDVGFAARDLISGDLDEDGFADVVLVSPTVNEVRILRGSATGALVAAPSISVTAPVAVAMGELGLDGKRGLVVAGATGVHAFRLSAEGELALWGSSTEASSVDRLHVRHLGPDQPPELLVLTTERLLVAYLGAASDTFLMHERQRFAIDGEVALGDLRGFGQDGYVYSRDGWRYFFDGGPLPFEEGNAKELVVGDLNADRIDDVIFTNLAGALTAYVSKPPPGCPPYAPLGGFSADVGKVITADLNGDGKPDLLGQASGAVEWSLGVDGDRFAPAVRRELGGTVSIAAGDVDGDGAAEALVGSSAKAALSVFHITSQGASLREVPLPSPAGAVACATPPLQRRCLVQVATEGAVLRLSFDAAGAEVDRKEAPGVPVPRVIAAADLDLDREVDAVVAGADGQIRVIWGGPTLQPGPTMRAPAGPPLDVMVVNLSGDGAPDLLISFADEDAVAHLPNEGARVIRGPRIYPSTRGLRFIGTGSYWSGDYGIATADGQLYWIEPGGAGLTTTQVERRGGVPLAMAEAQDGTPHLACTREGVIRLEPYWR